MTDKKELDKAELEELVAAYRLWPRGGREINKTKRVLRSAGHDTQCICHEEMVLAFYRISKTKISPA